MARVPQTGCHKLVVTAVESHSPPLAAPAAPTRVAIPGGGLQRGRTTMAPRLQRVLAFLEHGGEDAERVDDADKASTGGDQHSSTVSNYVICTSSPTLAASPRRTAGVRTSATRLVFSDDSCSRASAATVLLRLLGLSLHPPLPVKPPGCFGEE